MEIIVGLNPVLEALRARASAFKCLYVAKRRSGPVVAQLLELAKVHGLRIIRLDRLELDRISGQTHHQGVVAEIGPYAYYTLEQILERSIGRRALVIILDGIQDPMNLGSIIRSAEAAGASGVILPRERAAAVTPTVMKAAAGAAEFMPVARVVNIVQALETVKSAGFWIIGTDAQASRNIFDVDLTMSLALIVGGEGRGIRRLVKEKCDLLVSIPLSGQVNSLNAAMAATVAMFEYIRQNRL
ncbi:MAG: 23S rRNA (guanosine(2251)-2'-O)-methyltransferase RlmB [Deltaproteobacteria bacterium]|nr:23S rRNA (guanosine(2251)-2'-O)-methyltransferase RlmB [Deltaproteobacteria bacterium]